MFMLVLMIVQNEMKAHMEEKVHHGYIALSRQIE